MRMRVYNFLVNRHDGIRVRYHRLHDGKYGKEKILSYIYLLWLNFCYYILHCRFLNKIGTVDMYEKKRLLTKDSESAAMSKAGISVDSFVECLSQYDIISFDLFDTLIFRPFSEPGDLFYFLGEQLGLMNFKSIRIEQEALARIECYQERGHYEVAFSDIWNHIEQETGISAAQGMEIEQRLEMQFCYANPFMAEVFHRLQSKGKKIIVVSDMYLSRAFLQKLLEKNGYRGISKFYISCEYGKSKSDGKLYKLVKEDFDTNTKIIHVGDNEYSDIKMGKECGFNVKYYPNINKNAQLFRPYDMSPMVGGAYRGVVDNHIYCGLHSYSMEYEYGFIYGGLFVLGYCVFIHNYCKKNSVDKILFLSRDGDILKQVYDCLYQNENTEYVYWSRKAATKLGARFDKHDYFRRFIFHKVNQGYSIREVLGSMELEFLINGFEEGAEEELTDRNALLLRQFIEKNWDHVLEIYSEQNKAAKIYFGKVLAGIQKVAAVDIGWAGSGAMMLRQLVNKEWKIPCEVIGMIAGTNTIYNVEPDASEGFLQSGQMVAYLYSQMHNRDLLKKHDLNKDYNVFWELLLSSPTLQFKGFYLGEDSCSVNLAFQKDDANQGEIRAIQRGILDFVLQYQERFRDFPYMLQIGGRDAYAPMLIAASYGEKYLKEMEQKFALDINVN